MKFKAWVKTAALYLTAGIILGLCFSFFLNWYRMPKAFVFKVPPAFSSYINAAMDAMTIANKLESTTQQAEQTQLEQQLTETYALAESTQATLEKTLIKAKQKYDSEELTASIDTFLAWLAQQDIQKVKTSSQRVQWYSKTSQYEDSITLHLRQISGIYDIDNPRFAKIMSLVPKAQESLINNPNDKALCTVMQQHEKTREPEKIAAQIAFVEIGEQYCDQYYHSREAWGLPQLTYHPTKEEIENYIAQKAYDALPYNIYYETFVLPEIKRITKQLPHSEKILASVCGSAWGFAKERDPELDASRDIYRNNTHLCSRKRSDANLKVKSYSNTAYNCLYLATYFCGEDDANAWNYCDAYERCKPTGGVIFNE